MNDTLLQYLVCPESKGALVFDEKTQELVCETSGLAYPVRDGTPVMLISEARKISDVPA